MSDKKNIDRLFQEKFKDFEVEPNEQIWNNIDAVLRENKKRRVVPFWFKLSGIAAGLVLGFLAFSFLFDDSTPAENNPIVIGAEQPSNNNNSIGIPENESVVATPNKGNTVPSSPINQKTEDNNSTSGNNNAVATQSKSDKPSNNSINSGASSAKRNAVASASKQIEKNAAREKTVKNAIVPQDQHNAIVHNGPQSGTDKETSTTTNAKNINSISKENNAVVLEDEKNSDNGNFPEKNTSTGKQLNTSIAEHKKTAVEQKSIEKDNFHPIVVAENTTPIKKDSTAIAVAVPNALEELLKKNEEEQHTIAEAKMNRWQITSNVAPIYFSSTSNGSPIDEQFAENSKSYENNLSFGVGVNYAVSKKLSVRTGVNKFTLGYSTNDVVFFAAMDKVSFGSVASSDAGSTIEVVSQNNTEALRPFDNDIQNTNEGFMTQRMGYFEVPLEMSYKIIDKKFGINLIGGVSTLFLNENEVSVSSSTMSASLGRAKNLNDVHFSTNVGLGFRYRFLKSFEANFEPMFKYQINTFNKDAGNFKPYFIGLYSGVSFNF